MISKFVLDELQYWRMEEDKEVQKIRGYDAIKMFKYYRVSMMLLCNCVIINIVLL